MSLARPRPQPRPRQRRFCVKLEGDGDASAATLPLALPCPLLQPGVGLSVVTTSVEQPRLCFELRDRDVDAAIISVSEAVGLDGPAGRGHKVSFA